MRIAFLSSQSLPDLFLERGSSRLCFEQYDQSFGIRRSNSVPGYTIGPISAAVRDRILVRLWRCKEQELKQMWRRVSGIPGAGGIIFEYLFQRRFSKRIQITAVPMFQFGDSAHSRWHATFGHFAAGSKLDKAKRT